jgi:hypothetical protein
MVDGPPGWQQTLTSGTWREHAETVMRSVALALVLAVGPTVPTLCAFACVETGADHDTHEASAGHDHQATAVPQMASLGDVPCQHTGGLTSVVPAERSEARLMLAPLAVGGTAAGHVDDRSMAGWGPAPVDSRPRRGPTPLYLLASTFLI